VIAEGSGKLSEAPFAKEATQDMDFFGDASPFKAKPPPFQPASPTPKNLFAPSGSEPGGFADFKPFAADFDSNFPGERCCPSGSKVVVPLARLFFKTLKPARVVL
jgi:hypothetical protein